MSWLQWDEEWSAAITPFGARWPDSFSRIDRGDSPEYWSVVRFEIDAVLFDIDGTLIDSTAAIERFWHTWSSRHGIDADEVLRVCYGRRTDDTVAHFLPPVQLAAILPPRRAALQRRPHAFQGAPLAQPRHGRLAGVERLDDRRVRPSRPCGALVGLQQDAGVGQRAGAAPAAIRRCRRSRTAGSNSTTYCLRMPRGYRTPGPSLKSRVSRH